MELQDEENASGRQHSAEAEQADAPAQKAPADSCEPAPLERVAEAGEAQPSASASDMQGSLSACQHLEIEESADGSRQPPDADGEVNSSRRDEVRLLIPDLILSIPICEV